MKLTWKDLSIDISNIDRNKLIADWTWLIGTDKEPLMITSIGDMFLQDKKGKIFLLNIGEGLLDLVSENIEDFNSKLKDESQVDEWFMIGLVQQIKELPDGTKVNFKVID